MHEAAERNGGHLPYRLTDSAAKERRAEADREAQDPHAKSPRYEVVTELVQNDERRDTDDGEGDGHVQRLAEKRRSAPAGNRARAVWVASRTRSRPWHHARRRKNRRGAI